MINATEAYSLYENRDEHSIEEAIESLSPVIIANAQNGKSCILINKVRTCGLPGYQIRNIWDNIGSDIHRKIVGRIQQNYGYKVIVNENSTMISWGKEKTEEEIRNKAEDIQKIS